MTVSLFGSQGWRVAAFCLCTGVFSLAALSCDGDQGRDGGLDSASVDASDEVGDTGCDTTGCGHDATDASDASDDGAVRDDSDTTICTEGQTRCDGQTAQTCQDNAWADSADCSAPDQMCFDGACIDELPDCREMRVYDWTDLDDGVIEEGYFSEHHWGTNIHHDPESISVVSSSEHLREPATKSLRFYIDPRNPPPGDSTSDAGNLRAEIYESYEFHTGDTVSWAPDKPLKSEEWISWSYYYPPDFVAGETASTKFLQAHVGHGAAPIDLRLWNPTDYPDYPVGRCAGGDCDEFVLHRYYPDDGMDGDVAITDVKPEGGQWYDFVLHTVWDTESGGEGLTEFWINGTKYYSSAGGNTFENPENKDHPYGAMIKLGMYHGTWRYEDDIQDSLDEGVDHLEVFMGPVRILSRLEGDHIGADGLECVSPTTPRP